MSMYENVSSKAREIIDDCKNGELVLADEESVEVSFKFNQRETIRRIDYYINSRFLTREDGIFWNISNSRIVHFAKNIDLDTKDLMPYGIGEVNFWDSWRARIMFRKWLDDNEMAIKLNDLSEGCATYGSQIWKVYENDSKIMMKEVPLQNMYFDQSIEYLKDADGMVELHELSKGELWRKKDVWDNIQEVIKKNSGKNKIELWEYWGYFSENDEEEPVYVHEIGYGFGSDYISLWKEEDVAETDCPYFDFHIGRYRKRWLRTGVVERLFSLQERANTIVNQNAEATSIASLLLLRTNDPNTNGNVLEQAVSGQIINSEDLQQIGIDNRAFTILLNELRTIEAQANQLCLTPDVVQGEFGPSGTPFRSTALSANNAKSSFAYIKQRIGEMLSYMLNVKAIPKLKKEWAKEGIEEIVENEQDFKLYDEQIYLKSEIELISRNLEKGIVTTDEDLTALRQKVDSEIGTIGRRLENKAGSFNFKFGIKFNVTGESVDKAQQNDAYANIITWKLQNPAIGADPYFRQYVENNGITPIRMGKKELTEQVDQMQQGAQAGGLNASQPAKPDQDRLGAMVDTSQ